jgi:hypothetical protein
MTQKVSVQNKRCQQLLWGLRGVFSKISEAMDYFRYHDPLDGRLANVANELLDVMWCCKAILKANI